MGVYIYPGFAMATLSWQIGANPHIQQCTWGISPVVGQSAADVAAMVDTAWGLSFINSTLSNAYTWLPTKASLRLSADADPVLGVAGVNVNGTSAGETSPPNVAILVHKRTDFGGRRGQGRCYIPGGYLSDPSVGNTGAITTGALATLNTNINGFRTKIETAGGRLVLLHESESILPRNIIGVDVDAVIATQRRRLR